MRALGPFLRDAWRLAVPYFKSEERWSARGLLAAIIALNLSLVGMNVVLSYWNRAFYNALQDRDWDSFINLLLLYRKTEGGWLPGFCEIAAVFILVAIYRTWLNQLLQIRWRRWMTEHLLHDWLAEHAYWRLSLSAAGYGTDNPDQRIAEDLRDFAGDTLSLGLGLLSNLVTLFSFLTILWTLSGPLELLGITIPGYMVWVALVYAAIGTTLTHLVGRPLVALNFRQQRVEADFRFSLARVRENVEGIALYGGEAQERMTASELFGRVIANWRQIMDRTKLLNALVSGYDQISVIFPIVVAAPRYFAGSIQLGALMQTTSSFGRVESAMSWFVHAYSSLASWRATVERLSGFRQAIAVAREQGQGPQLRTGGRDFVLSGLSLDLPDGRRLLDLDGVTLREGEDAVITGPSGLGKSTLFRALAGIWPFGDGTVRRPAGKILFLPQRPYIPLGTLRRAIAYPDAPHGDATELDALHAVGLGHLEALLDTEAAWSQRLSGGEQQRLAIARALIVQPDWLFMDEATASLDPKAEAELYALLRARLPGTTLVSIAHRETVAGMHARRLELTPDAAGTAVMAK